MDNSHNHNTDNRDRKNTAAGSLKIYARRAALLLFALLIAAGIMHTYFADWRLKAAAGPENAAADNNITSEEEISVDGRDDPDADENVQEPAAESGVTEDVIELKQQEEHDDGSSEEIPDSSTDTDKARKPEAKLAEAVFEGEDYTVTLTDPSESLPADTELVVTEILPGTEEYRIYSMQAQNTITDEAADPSAEIGFARFFDITIMSGGKEYEPENPVNVSITLDTEIRKELTEGDEDALKVLHFTEDEKTGDIETEIIEDVGVAGDTVSFEAGSFSVYAIIEAPEPKPTEIITEDEVTDISEEAVYLSYNGTKMYMSAELNRNSAFIEVTSNAEADEWYFEKTGEEGSGEYYIYTINDGSRRYISNTKDNLAGLTDSAQTVFTLTHADSDKVYIKVSDSNRWLQHSNGGGGIRFYTDNNNAVNSRFTITYVSSYTPEDDTYELDGMKAGIAYHDESVTAAALTSGAKTVSSSGGLAAQDMLIRPDVLDNEGVLLVAEDSDITEWTFRSAGTDKYYITVTVDNTEKYLTINKGNVTLEDVPDEQYSVITAVPGTGTNSGKWHFSVNGYSLNLSGGSSGGFNAASGSGSTTWMNLVRKSVLGDDDFTLYNARKVSVSDTENVYNYRQVVIYTRIWNDSTKRYEFYAVDHDGSLIRCYDTGDSIEWIGSQINKTLWELTEGRNSDGSLNYYYYLRNTIDGTYIVPQMTSGEVIYTSTENQGTEDFNASVNLNGRRNGENYTTIIAWDDEQYSYSGLRTENGKVAACPLSEAEDFYFAVIGPAGERDELTTVKTIDSNAYGITMKMVDFNNSSQPGVNRDPVQNPFFGGDNNNAGLLASSLKENGYPDTTSLTGRERNLSELFTDMQSVNNLFIQSIYNESGYFEYDSTSNFAHLNDDGTFTVYDQIAAIGNENSNTRAHGQFMPYNTIEAGKFSSTVNRTTVTQTELADTDPRKGEKLYLIDDPDYFFGMEMEAAFTQTANGLDAWGHDIIFEFSGDDDFWLYVDGELILDLGGVHSAMTGSINFRTGEVRSTRGNSTLYDLFISNYRSRGLSETEISSRLSDMFEKKKVDGKYVYVFRDYSNHSMKMFYMERGAGASNLHMRFNLAAVKPGTFILSKKLSGTDSSSNDLIEFPYQIYYKTDKDGDRTDYHLLGANDGEADGVLYKGTASKVRHLERFTPAGTETEYSHVFMLKAGQSAEVNLPDNTRDYYVTECGINPEVYESVSANGEVLTGSPSGSSADTVRREDYSISPSSLEERSQVDFDNKVSPGAMRTLHITKRLYDSDGSTQLTYDDDRTAFSFRLYLGNENTDPSDLPLADLYSYYVLDPDGHYCRWDAGSQEFVPVQYNGSTIDDYHTLRGYLAGLSRSQRDTIVFRTSMNGSISRIPADHTVEVRDLIVDTRYKAEEREYEIPKGYTLRLDDGYSEIADDKVIKHGTEPVSGIVAVNTDPDIEIRNQKGWGLTVRKTWTDGDFMESHDPVYFAVYVRNGNDAVLLEDTVRRMTDAVRGSELYYFFGNLQSGTPFTDYFIREVRVTPPSGADELTADSDGYVREYGEVIPVEAGEPITVGGKPAGGEYRDDYEYRVIYKVGEQTTQNENVRTDEVTNSRPGIRLYKTDWNGDPLGKTVFTLKDADGGYVAASAYTSGAEDGLITTAYLNAGRYMLKEIYTPSGYISMPSQMIIDVDDAGKITISGIDEDLYDIDIGDAEMTAVVTIRNRPVSLKAVKTDSITGEPLSGVHFALYKQVQDKDGDPVKDYMPLSGYEDLVTDERGLLDNITMGLGMGTYYLTETRALPGYELPGGDIVFTISGDGTVTLNYTGTAYGRLSESVDDVSGSKQYAITASNGKQKNVSIRKVSAETGEGLAGASFELYSRDAYDPASGMITDGASYITAYTNGSDGIWTVGSLPAGDYILVETAAPAGYKAAGSPYVISVRADSVTAMLADGIASCSTVHMTEEDLWEIEISNSAGTELPSTGGRGVLVIYLAGILLIAASAAVKYIYK